MWTPLCDAVQWLVYSDASIKTTYVTGASFLNKSPRGLDIDTLLGHLRVAR